MEQVVEEQTATMVVDVPTVDFPPARARLGDLVWREDREELAVMTVFGWQPCRVHRPAGGRA